MKTGSSCGGRVKSAPHLYRSGRGVKGWRGSKEELRDRKAFKKLSPKEAARIEEERLARLRETMDGILE